jgi:hypothetical protein
MAAAKPVTLDDAFARLESFQAVAGIRKDQDFDPAAIERMTESEVLLSRPVTDDVLAYVRGLMAQGMPAKMRRRFANADRYLAALQVRQRAVFADARPVFERATVIARALDLHCECGVGSKERFNELLAELEAIENRFAV